MDIKNLMDSLGGNKEEVLKKAAQCKTAEELMKLAEENKITLTKEDAVELLGSMNPKAGELSENELDAVAGGISGYKEFTCERCKKRYAFCQCPR